MVCVPDLFLAVRVNMSNPDSRKRRLDGDIDNGSTKKSNIASGESSLHLKLLVPSVAAGAIIGKRGETIEQIQIDANAKVKMSKPNDFYPGTSERVCLITGNVESILQIFNFIMEKIKEKPDHVAKPAIDFDNKVPAEREKQVKILVPNSTAGMIIGKGGAYIKKIKEDSGCYMQISQKAKVASLAERCITIIGDMQQNGKACEMILSKICEDPQSGSCLNVSYADISGPVANFNPTGSPFATNNSRSGNPSHPPPFSPPERLMSGVAVNFTLNFCPAGPATSVSNLPSNVVSQLMDNVRIMLRNTGYSQHSSQEILNNLYTLARYGFLGVDLGSLSDMPHSNSFQRTFDRLPLDSGDSLRRPISGRNSPSNGHLSANSKKRSSSGDGITQIEIEIAENIIGAVLGLAGKSLIEIQRYSGAMIQISKKGSFAPGTRNRIVTITGTLNGIGMARYMIEQRIREEESKRSRQEMMS